MTDIEKLKIAFVALSLALFWLAYQYYRLRSRVDKHDPSIRDLERFQEKVTTWARSVEAMLSRVFTDSPKTFIAYSGWPKEETLLWLVRDLKERILKIGEAVAMPKQQQAKELLQNDLREKLKKSADEIYEEFWKEAYLGWSQPYKDHEAWKNGSVSVVYDKNASKTDIDRDLRAAHYRIMRELEK